MTEDVKTTLIICFFATMALFGMFAACNGSERGSHYREMRLREIDAAAPVVETCIKHPVTRSPL